MGKWDEVIKQRGLKRMPHEDEKHQEKVNRLKVDLITKHGNEGRLPIPSELTRLWLSARARKEDLEEQLSKVELELEGIKQLSDDAFENEGIKSMKLATGQGMRYEAAPSARVVDKAAPRRWIIAEGLEDDLSVNYSRLEAIIKERLEAHLPDPDGVVLFVRTKWVKL